jgi:agmatine deiminase
MPSPLTTPAAHGYRMPAEWEEHNRTWMLWPYRPDVWRENARPAQEAFVRVAAAIARFEPVTVIVLPPLVDDARRMLSQEVQIVPMPYNDAWLRDNGPTFLVDGPGALAGVDWPFNAWGGHYRNYAEDDALAGHILDAAGARRYRADLVMEGGALHTDGEGTLLVVEECLLHHSRNPHLGKEEIEARLKQWLNIQRVIWLPFGVIHDETAGHVDNLACFVRPGVVALTWTDDERDPQRARSLAAERTLLTHRDAAGASVGSPPHSPARPSLHDRRRGVHDFAQRRQPPPLGRRTTGRILHQPLHRQWRGNRPCFRRPPRRARAGETGRALPRAGDRPRTGPGDIAGRGECALHYAATTAEDDRVKG